jgi:hypothetical protein
MKHGAQSNQTNDFKTALLSAHGKHIKHGGRQWKLDCKEIFSTYYQREVFTCNAENLTPSNAEEREFCITDLWLSQSENADAIAMKFARLGGYIY